MKDVTWVEIMISLTTHQDVFLLFFIAYTFYRTVYWESTELSYIFVVWIITETERFKQNPCQVTLTLISKAIQLTNPQNIGNIVCNFFTSSSFILLFIHKHLITVQCNKQELLKWRKRKVAKGIWFKRNIYSI